MQTEAPESMISIAAVSEMALRQVTLCRVEMNPVGVVVGVVVELWRLRRLIAIILLGSWLPRLRMCVGVTGVGGGAGWEAHPLVY